MEKNILAQFINNIPHFIWWKDLNGVFLGCNNNFLEYTGLKNKNELVGKTDFDLWDKDEATFFRKIDNEIVSSGKSQLNFEEPITLSDLGKRWLSTSKMPLRDNENKIIGTIGWFDDITTRKELEAVVLNAKEEQYKILLDSMSASVITIELTHNEQDKAVDYFIRDLNLSAAKFYGKTKELLINKKISDIRNAVDYDLLATFNKVAQTGITMPFDFHADAEDRYLSGTIWKIDAGKLGVLFEDITEQKRNQESKAAAQLKLEIVRNELNEAQKLAKIGSWILNPITKEAEWSDEMYNIWGLEVPLYEEALKRIHPDDIEQYKKAVALASSKGIPYDIEFRVQIPDMERKTVRSICQPVLDDSGAVIKLTGSNQDISAQKKFEVAHIKHQRLKAIGEMSSSIAHDFNNSLQEMMGNLEIVKLQDGLSDASIDRLNNISAAIKDAADRVSALQKFGDTELDTTQNKNVNLNTLIEESLNQSRPLWKDRMEKEGFRVDVTTELEAIPNLRCNPGELKSVIYNLIKNSIEAMPSGGELIISTKLKGESIVATFKDTGVGMSKESKLNVFQPFYSTKGFELGRGLGMSGTYRTIKKYGGDITVDYSEINKGSSFEIILPIGSQIEDKKIIEDKIKVTKNLKVLWVDDDTLITETVCELVHSFDHKCDIANNGVDALEYLATNTYDIVFTDIGMPDMNGWELADAIREKYGAAIKIVVVSGWDVKSADIEKHAINSILQKPFLLEDLEKQLLLA